MIQLESTLTVFVHCAHAHKYNYCNYILFTKLLWPGDISEETFRFSNQAATYSSVFHTQWKLHIVSLITERQAGKLRISIFIVSGLTRLGIEPEHTVSVADILSTRTLIGYNSVLRIYSRKYKNRKHFVKLLVIVFKSMSKYDVANIV